MRKRDGVMWSCFITAFCLLPVGARPALAQLKAGVARADITPPIGDRMYGYSARGSNVSQGVHDALYAKAIVLSDGTTKVALVTLDIGSVTAETTTAVRTIVAAEAGIQHVLLLASHTHSAPALTPGFPSTEKPYVREMEQKVARVIVEACGSLQPARLGVGWDRVEEGHNRRRVTSDGTVEMFWGNRERLPTSPVDHSVGVIAVDTPDGKPLATLVNFACHPVVLGPENLQISADYPGAMASYVEQRDGGQCMFVQGAAGDINPFWDKTPPAEGGFEQMTKMGETIGREVVRVRQGIAQFERGQTISVRQQVVPLDTRWDLSDPAVQDAVRKRFGQSTLQLYIARTQHGLAAEVNTVLIGADLALASFPGEFFVEHGLNLKRSCIVKNTMFAGYCNGALGYFPTIRAAAEGGYGGKSATIVEVGAGEKLVNRALVNLHYQAGMLSKVPRF